MSKLFPISIEVEEVAVGKVLRILNATEGIVRLHLKLTQDKEPKLGTEQDGGAVNTTPVLRDGRSNKRNIPTAHNKCYQVIAEVLLKTPAHYKILAAALERTGYKASGIHGFIYRMGKMKLIQRTSPGSYKITEKGQRVFANPKRLIPTPPQLPPHLYKVTNNYSGFRLFVLTTLYREGPVSSVHMRERVSDGGFSEKNLSTTGMKMRNEGLFSVEDGVYTITEKGTEVLEKRPLNDVEDGHNLSERTE